MKVKDVMHSGAVWVNPDTPVSELAKMMRDQDIGSIPIGKNDRLVGIVTDRDIVCRGLANGGDCETLTALDVMSKPIVYCRSEDDVEEALHIMEKNKVRRLPVINENKRLVGMLALGDLCGRLPRDLTGEVVCSIAAHHA